MSETPGDTPSGASSDEVRDRIRVSDTPIYTGLSIETGVQVPDPLPADPLLELLGVGPSPDRDVAPTTIQPAVPRLGAADGERLPVPDEQDDLTAYDRDLDLVNTPKVGPVDEVLHQPPQDPAWRPMLGDTL